MKRKPTSDPAITVERLREWLSAFRLSRVLLTAVELDVFNVLGDTFRSPLQIAGRIRADRRATARLLATLCGLGLLVEKEGRFANAPAARRLLVRDGAQYQAGLGHSVNLWKTWSTLTAAVRRGHGVSRSPWRRADLRGFIAAMHDRAAPAAAAVVARVGLAGVRRLLDVGGGSGAYALAFARAKPGLEAVVFDLPDVVPLTRAYIASAGLADRVHVQAGDYLGGPLPGGFDLVFLSAVVHSNLPAENRRLIAACARALNRGGRIVVQDYIMDEGRTQPLAGALFALNMLVNTKGGDTYTASEIASWMKAAGLSAIRLRKLPAGSSLLSGRLN